MRGVLKFWAVAFVLVASFAQAQERSDASAIIEQRIEALAEQLDEENELDYTTLFDRFSRFLEKPLNLNAATYEELQDLLLLSDRQCLAITEHIADHGKLLSVYELQAVEGLDLATIRSIQPFVGVSAVSELGRLTWKELWEAGSHDLVFRYQRTIEDQAGFMNGDDDSETNDFEGDPARLFTRYRFRYKDHLSVGFTAEKDPGESFFSGSNPNGFDFYSGHLFYSDDTFIRNVALGDFQVQFGQGVTAWSGLGFGKSAYVMNVKRNGRGIRPYTSVDENRFLRGGAVTLGWKDWELTGFASVKNIDANILEPDSLDDPDLITISSFQLTGLHRTIGEIEDQDAIQERHYGGHLRYRTRNFSFGLTGIATRINADLTRNLFTYNQFEFNDDENLVVGVDYHYLRGNVNVFGEFSRSQSGGVALLQGALISLHHNLSASLLYRRYDRDYQNALGLPFGELSKPANESGIYAGLEWLLNRQWRFSTYVDQFRFPWLRYRVDAPSSGVDHLAQLTWKPSRKAEFYVRYRQRVRARNSTAEDIAIDQPVDEFREQIRLNAAYHVTPAVRFKTRMEWMHFELGDEGRDNGFLFAQDLIIKPLQSPISFAGRFALFDISSWDARIYAYENDVLYSWSIPPYFGRGARVYAMVKWRVYRKVDLWVRWSRWTYTDRDEVGSGLNAIDGNQRSEIKVQVRWRF